MPASAVYSHLSGSPVLLSGGLQCSVCLDIAFTDAPPGAGDPVSDTGLWFQKDCYQPSEEDGSYSFTIGAGDGSSTVERAHLSAKLAIKQIANGRGFSIDGDNITYAGA